MSNERVAECIAAIQSWEKTARGLLDGMYPAGSVIAVRLTGNQKTPSNAEVIWAPWEDAAHIRVRLLGAKERTRRPFRSIHYTAVVGVIVKGDGHADK